ncbi:MAG: acyltransferase family protein [Firmicutes bacterium]|nr:acyltransferase family protein [Bacillota bacterium]
MYGQESKRSLPLDIAKGIGILLVVLGHCLQVHAPLKQWIYSFHVPLFFLISGMVWDRTSHEESGFLNGAFLAKKAMRLLAPCFLWGLAYALARALVYRSLKLESLGWLLYNTENSISRAGSLTPLWFLSCMFVTVCLFEAIQWLACKKRLSKWALFGMSLVFGALGLFLPVLAVGYPWSVDVAMLGLALMIWGYLARETMDKLTEKPWLCLLMSLGALAVLTLTYRLDLSGLTHGYVEVSDRVFGEPALFLLDALCGSLFVLGLSAFLAGFSLLDGLLSRLGRDTIPILLFHKPVALALGVVFGKMGVPDAMAVAIEFVFALVISEGIFVLTRPLFPWAYGESERPRYGSERGAARYR